MKQQLTVALNELEEMRVARARQSELVEAIVRQVCFDLDLRLDACLY
jgi:hypothetical protein